MDSGLRRAEARQSADAAGQVGSTLEATAPASGSARDARAVQMFDGDTSVVGSAPATPVGGAVAHFYLPEGNTTDAGSEEPEGTGGGYGGGDTDCSSTTGKVQVSANENVITLSTDPGGGAEAVTATLSLE